MKESARDKKFIIHYYTQKVNCKINFKKIQDFFGPLWNKVPVERYAERDVDAR